MPVKTINLRDFTDTPGGRYLKDGPHSGMDDLSDSRLTINADTDIVSRNLVFTDRQGRLPIVEVIVDKNGFMPEKAHSEDSGYDLRTAEYFSISPGQTVLVHTGIRLCLERASSFDYLVEAQVRSKSGLALKHNIHVLNSPGTIDCGYTGEVCVILHREYSLIDVSDSTEVYVQKCIPEPIYFRPGDKIAQLVFNIVPQVVLKSTDYIDDTERGDRGFGSTGK